MPAMWGACCKLSQPYSLQIPAPLLGPTRASSHLLSCLNRQEVVVGREGFGGQRWERRMGWMGKTKPPRRKFQGGEGGDEGEKLDLWVLLLDSARQQPDLKSRGLKKLVKKENLPSWPSKSLFPHPPFWLLVHSVMPWLSLYHPMPTPSRSPAASLPTGTTRLPVGSMGRAATWKRGAMRHVPENLPRASAVPWSAGEPGLASGSPEPVLPIPRASRMAPGRTRASELPLPPILVQIQATSPCRGPDRAGGTEGSRSFCGTLPGGTRLARRMSHRGRGMAAPQALLRVPGGRGRAGSRHEGGRWPVFGVCVRQRGP